MTSSVGVKLRAEIFEPKSTLIKQIFFLVLNYDSIQRNKAP